MSVYTVTKNNNNVLSQDLYSQDEAAKQVNFTENSAAIFCRELNSELGKAFSNAKQLIGCPGDNFVEEPQLSELKKTIKVLNAGLSEYAKEKLTLFLNSFSFIFNNKDEFKNILMFDFFQNTIDAQKNENIVIQGDSGLAAMGLLMIRQVLEYIAEDAPNVKILDTLKPILKELRDFLFRSAVCLRKQALPTTDLHSNLSEIDKKRGFFINSADLFFSDEQEKKILSLIQEKSIDNDFMLMVRSTKEAARANAVMGHKTGSYEEYFNIESVKESRFAVVTFFYLLGQWRTQFGKHRESIPFKLAPVTDDSEPGIQDIKTGVKWSSVNVPMVSKIFESSEIKFFVNSDLIAYELDLKRKPNEDEVNKHEPLKILISMKNDGSATKRVDFDKIVDGLKRFNGNTEVTMPVLNAKTEINMRGNLDYFVETSKESGNEKFKESGRFLDKSTERCGDITTKKFVCNG